jgi:hypothetical protein
MICGPSGPNNQGCGEVLKLNLNSTKQEVLAHFGHPVVQVELEEIHFDTIFRTAGNFIAGYFPFEEKIATFYTKPLVNEYDLPPDAYWIKQVKWDPSVTRIGDIFGAESFLFNIGNITGLQGMLLDYHLIQAYRKFSQRVLATEGRWEVKGNNKIRLLPIPRGTYPVFVEYFPCVEEFRSPWARELTKRIVMAEAAMILGNIRSKRALPTPDGGTTTFNGEDLLTWGREEREKVLKDAINLTEPPGIYPY